MIVLIVSLFILIQLPGVQTYLAKKGAKYLSKELDTKVDIKYLYIEPFQSLVLEDLYIQDKDKDTLLYTHKFNIDIADLSFSKRKINVRSIALNRGHFNLKEYKDSTTNLSFIINYFDSGTPSEKKKATGKPYDLLFSKIILKGMTFKYKNFAYTEPVKGVNFDDVELRDLNATLFDLDFTKHLFKADVRNLSFREKSGFVVNELSTDAVVDTNQMEFKRLNIVTPNSTVRNYFLMKYKTFDDFNDFINKVYVRGNLRNSTVDSKDISFFTEELDRIHMNLRVKMTGTLSGYVNNIKARNCAIMAGQATYIKGDFDIKGLPDVDKTLMSLKVNQLATNRRDANMVIKQIMGEKELIPETVDPLGNVNFKGTVKGGFYHFTTKGELKTALGRLLPDIDINLNGKGALNGKVQGIDFNLGKFIDTEESLGRTSMLAEIHGTGLSLKDMHQEITIHGEYFQALKYRYANLSVHGLLAQQQFKGTVSIADHNLTMQAEGVVSLDSHKPGTTFDAAIKSAHLHKLHLTSDTVSISTLIKGQIRGNNINTAEGELAISKFKINSPDTSFVVNSLAINAEGTGKNRHIGIKSEIMEGYIEGEYELSSLPDYILWLAKQYVPSLAYKPRKFPKQNITAYLKVNDFAPLSLLFAPKIRFPDGVVLNMKFSTDEKSNGLSIAGKSMEYGKIRIENFILDGLAEGSQMNVFYTADNIRLTDSLYLRNINIANILKNDSLNFNIKLSDKSAADQLDLNGLVLFRADSSALLNILPSDIIIGGQNWKVREKASIEFEKDKLVLSQFALNNGEQNLMIDGAISSKENDALNLKFDKFQVATFNPLTKVFGINLKGVINGDVEVKQVTKNPRVVSMLKADSLVMNNIELGTLTARAGMDNARSLVGVLITLEHADKQTIEAFGTYNFRSETNSLDLNVKMNDSDLILAEPFTTGLVSNITGKVSTNLKINGTLLEPSINGKLFFNEGSFVVDYLKTRYSTSDTISIENSVAHLNHFNIQDINNHNAQLNGSVDFHTLNNPIIDITSRANNLMVLNTTAKDNNLYYGKGFATGTFRFKGPVDNMNIDIRATANEGTIFNIPLNSSETIGNNDFISFVNKDSLNTPKPKTFFTPGLVMNFNLNIDEGSQVNIFTNLGKLSARGNSSMIMKVTSSGDFEMYGDYLVTNGKFQFTAQDFINKIFDIRQGGSIRWTSGDPTAAQININAIYALRTDVRALYTAAGRAANEGTVQTEAIMKLSGTLAQPDISFDLDFPADANIKDELQGYLSDVNNKNSQALSLIVRRAFSPNTGNVSAEDVGGTFTNATAELLVNQLNSVLSQMLNLNFVDLNIRSLNEASASFRFLKDRLIITAGVTDMRTSLTHTNVSAANAVSRDAEMLYLIKKDGSLTARFSNKLNNRNFLNPEQEYISAFGLAYRKDFGTFGEFLRSLIGKQRAEERRPENKPVTPASSNPDNPSKAVLPKKNEIKQDNSSHTELD